MCELLHTSLVSKKCKVAKNPVGTGKGLGNVGARKVRPPGWVLERRGRAKRGKWQITTPLPRSRWRLVRRSGGPPPAALVQESPDGCLPAYGAGTPRACGLAPFRRGRRRGAKMAISTPSPSGAAPASGRGSRDG